MLPRWLALPLVLGVVLAAAARTQSEGADPESTSAGRTHYLGREIATTMHWRGASWLFPEGRGVRLLGLL